jgi:hypothetical protein
MVYGLWFRAWGLGVKPRLRVSSDAEGLARGQLAELHLWKSRKGFSILVNQPKRNQVLLSFPSSTRKRGFFTFCSRCEEDLKLLSLAEKRGSLEGSGRGGLRFKL